MARNRKRAKERRARRPESVAVTRGHGARQPAAPEPAAAPDPIAHATPDAELAEAQVALGRPDVVDEAVVDPQDEELRELAAEAQESGVDNGAGGRAEASAGSGASGRSQVARPTSAAPAHRQHVGARLIAFLQGSWAELQRVQWPDRRQVMQATGVVIGFVIVAGVFLGVADLAATKLVDFILK